MERPEKCLHCGGDAQIQSHIVFEYRGDDYRRHWNGDKYYIQCESCGIRTQDYYTGQEAHDAWNRRAQPEQPDVVHGRWVHIKEDGMTVAGKCSNCGYTIFNDSDETNYCPSCGAKMSVGEKDAAD